MTRPEKLFTDISQFIAESRALLDKGAMVELAGLDGRIKTLCGNVMKLSQEERIEYGAKLQTLLTELTALGDEMLAQRETLAKAILHLADHRKASTAYLITEASDKKGDKG